MEFFKRKLADIISDKPFLMKALHFLGVQFQQYADHTLEELCNEKGLTVQVVMQQFNAVSLERDSQPEILRSFPLDLVIGYLRHTHHIFIKNRLPFLNKLVSEAKWDWFPQRAMGQDLQFVFPLFAEDFIVHIYHEEDTLFTYVKQLMDALDGIENPAVLLQKMEHCSISALSHEHETHDDEMTGIRQLTQNYYLAPDASIGLQVLYHELQTFELELQRHAAIEDHILMPKAKNLESEIKWRLQQLVKLS